MDTQWPRYEVFEQEQPGQPHRNTGAVHAPDPELALQNARDVFVRRPEVSSLWVVPESQIYTWTSEALLADLSWQTETVGLARSVSPYEVFQKQTQRQSETYVTHVGTVEARSPSEALRQALARFDSGSVFVWWVVLDRAILRSTSDEAASLFEPAREKTYRRPNEYKVAAQMRSGPEATTGGTGPDESGPTGTGSSGHKPSGSSLSGSGLSGSGPEGRPR
jgi:ring-1,2-phenylacetyl-CoA epoxidase subunit PaaB